MARRRWRSEVIPYDPIDEADADLLKCVQLSERDLLLLLSQTNYLHWPTRYTSSTPGLVIAADVVDAWAALVEYRLLAAADCETEIVGCCEQFTPEQDWVAFFPGDPFTTPEYIPPGYLLPPFYTNPVIALPGVLPTDAILNFAALPLLQSWAELMATGLPRARINFTGSGQVEVEMIKLPQGGFAALTLDGDAGTMQVVNLAEFSITDLNDLNELVDFVVDGLVQVEIVEFNVIDAGAHYIDVTFLPNVGGDVILGFGGGIRSIEFCDGTGPGEAFEMQMDVIDGAPGCKVIRWRPTSSGAWIELTTVCDGADGADGAAAPPLHVGFDAANCTLKYTQGDINSPYVGGDWISVFDWNNSSLRDCLDDAPLPQLPPGIEDLSDICKIAWGAGIYFVEDVAGIHSWDLANGPFLSKPNLLGNIYADDPTTWLTFADIFYLSPVANAWTTPTAPQNAILLDPVTHKRYAEAFYCSLTMVEGQIQFNRTTFGAFVENLVNGNSIVDDALRTYKNLIRNERLQEYFIRAALEIDEADCAEFDCMENLAPLLVADTGTLQYDGDWHYAQVTFNGEPPNFNMSFHRVGGGCYTIRDYVLLASTHGSAQGRALCGGSFEFATVAETLDVSLASHYWRGSGGLSVKFRVELD